MDFGDCVELKRQTDGFLNDGIATSISENTERNLDARRAAADNRDRVEMNAQIKNVREEIEALKTKYIKYNFGAYNRLPNKPSGYFRYVFCVM